MGLDLRLVRVKGSTDTAESIEDVGYDIVLEGNGRYAFSFVREWFEYKKEDLGLNTYGQYLRLTEDDIDWLINKAIEQSAENGIFDSEDKFFLSAVTVEIDVANIYCAEQLVKILLTIKGLGDFTHYYLECDW